MEKHDQNAEKPQHDEKQQHAEKQPHAEKQQHDEKQRCDEDQPVMEKLATIVQSTMDQSLLEQLEGAGLEWSQNPFCATPPMGMHVPPPEEEYREKMFGKVGVRSTERKIYRGLKRKYGQQYADLQQELRLGTDGHLQMQGVHLANKERTLGFEFGRLLSNQTAVHQQAGGALVRVAGVPVGLLPCDSY